MANNNVMKFAKRFDMLAIKEKMATAEMLGKYVAENKMPSGREMVGSEWESLAILLEWTNENIFFGEIPSKLNEYFK